MTAEPTTSEQTTGGDGTTPGYLSRSQIRVVLGGLMAGMFLAALDQSIVGVALPKITSELGGLDKLSWVVTAYLLTSTAATPLWGKVSDLYGRRPMFQSAIVVFLIGSLICGFASPIAGALNVAGIDVHDRRTGGPGPGRWRSDVPGPGRDRRHHPAAGARPLPGPLRRRLRGLLGGRAPARRPVHRPPRLGVDLLHQHPDRRGRPRGDLDRPQAAPRTPGVPGRLPRRRAHRRRGDQPGALPELGRARRRLDLAHRTRPAGRHRRPRGGVRAGRAPGRRAHHPDRVSSGSGPSPRTWSSP